MGKTKSIQTESVYTSLSGQIIFNQRQAASSSIQANGIYCGFGCEESQIFCHKSTKAETTSIKRKERTYEETAILATCTDRQSRFKRRIYIELRCTNECKSVVVSSSQIRFLFHWAGATCVK